mmetsp:Transcript_21064/g.56719  ORF Transcript_21064/g.56719 Transcript_21064/m.56719 type:complete len:215 (-) Transcript_21064:110-754(-)
MHHNPEMEVKDDQSAQAVIFDLSQYDWESLHKLMRRLGFAYAPGKQAPAGVGHVAPLAIPASPAGLPATAGPGSLAAPTSNDAHTATAGSLPRGVADASMSGGGGEGAPSGLRGAVQSAIASGDEILTRGLMASGRRGPSATFVVLIASGVALLALFCLGGACAGQSSGPAQFDPGPALAAIAGGGGARYAAVGEVVGGACLSGGQLWDRTKAV